MCERGRLICRKSEAGSCWPRWPSVRSIFSGSGRAGCFGGLFSRPQRRQTLVLDAGHGGEDGGAVSLSGVPESGINLAIVQKLDQLLGLYGEAPLLLRSEDISLHDDSAQTLREKKSPTSTTVWPGSRRRSMLSCSAYTRIPFRTGSTTALRCSIPTESSVNLWHNSHRRHCGRTGPGQHP